MCGSAKLSLQDNPKNRLRYHQLKERRCQIWVRYILNISNWYMGTILYIYRPYMYQMLHISHQYLSHISYKSRSYLSNFKLGKIWKIQTPPPPQSKLVYIWNVDYFDFGAALPPPIGLFPQFGTFFMASLTENLEIAMNRIVKLQS